MRAFDGISCLEEGSASGGAVVVDIRDRDAGHAEVIKGTLHSETTRQRAGR